VGKPESELRARKDEFSGNMRIVAVVVTGGVGEGKFRFATWVGRGGEVEGAGRVLRGGG
jgi:hypothetical protein